jgi:transcription antitermination factor NusA-like protein
VLIEFFYLVLMEDYMYQVKCKARKRSKNAVAFAHIVHNMVNAMTRPINRTFRTVRNVSAKVNLKKIETISVSGGSMNSILHIYVSYDFF